MNKKSSNCFHIPLCIIILFLTCSGKQIDEPAIEFETETHDFGVVIEGEEVNYTYVFKNTGKEKTVITDVRPTCGCTLAGEYDREILPGGTGKIPVVLKTKGFQGEISKIIRVSTNVPQKEEIILTLSGSVHTPVIVDPRVVWLGQIESTTSTLHGLVTIKNNSDTPLKLLKIIPPDENVSVKSTTIKENQEYQIDISINPPFGSGSVRKYISIETNNPHRATLKVQYSYYIRDDIIVYPQIIYIAPGRSKEAFERIVKVENSLSEPVKIIKPHFTGGSVDFQIKEIKPGKYYQIKLLFPQGFTITGKNMFVFTFVVESTKGTEVFNIAIKPEQ